MYALFAISAIAAAFALTACSKTSLKHFDCFKTDSQNEEPYIDLTYDENTKEVYLYSDFYEKLVLIGTPEPGNNYEYTNTFVGDVYKEIGTSTEPEFYGYKWHFEIDLKNKSFSHTSNPVDLDETVAGFCVEGTPKTTEIFIPEN